MGDWTRFPDPGRPSAAAIPQLVVVPNRGEMPQWFSFSTRPGW
jgi:hypothetical protein